MKVDPSGYSWSSIFEFVRTAVTETGRIMGMLTPAYAGCGGAAVADGPLPFGDIAGMIGAAALTAGAIGAGVYNAAKTKSEVKVEEKEKEKEVVKKSPDDVIIYRYGDELYPSENDIAHFPQTLSFTTRKPRYPGYYMTTIEAVNATGALIAVQDGQYHVSVTPVGNYTMEDWYFSGKHHPYTQILESICVER